MREIMDKFVQTFSVKTVNWSAQMSILKKLLKTYSKEEIMFAIDYYAKKGVGMYSIGYLFTSMERPIKEYKTEEVVKTWSDDSATRNQRKFAENIKTRGRKKHYFDLFEEPREDN